MLQKLADNIIEVQIIRDKVQNNFAIDEITPQQYLKNVVVEQQTEDYIGLNYYFVIEFIKLSNALQEAKKQREDKQFILSNATYNQAIINFENEINRILVQNIANKLHYSLESMLAPQNNNESQEKTLLQVLKEAINNDKLSKRILKDEINVEHYDGHLFSEFKKALMTINDNMNKITNNHLQVGVLKITMLYLIQPICMLFKNQEWAKNLLTTKSALGLQTVTTSTKELIENLAQSAKRQSSGNSL